ncbi:30S ribosomal protein S12 methylthiotransferase accessory factor YcaO [Nitrincola tapanii]|uniref:30s ribosomal protein S12 methylthiotransferase accessory protein YcaO n=1 Tax=Nitrincola tapanii TaxID=1708751 RepID=A0A5A9W158_9GAMM|nr:30S ribosomal protein S12 methylthiotransferase accessory factor YcaO [Nitrincola tapanii]KAA0873949.1 30s ribosomal protein S12 methylthiotransferase accessory protein YcaO [Nitrincola tapanii]
MTQLLGKDAPLEESLVRMNQSLKALGFDLEEVSCLNPVPHVWSVHLQDRNCSLLFSHGKGSSRDAALASALGEFIERLATNYFFSDYFLGTKIAQSEFVHYPQERWFPLTANHWPEGLLDEATRNHYDLHNEMTLDQLVDLNSGYAERGICALPFVQQRSGATVWFPVNILGNLYVSNGMASGNSLWEARVQALSEIFERHIKNTILSSGISLPLIPESEIAKHPRVKAALRALRAKGFVLEVRDASLGGKFPLVNVILFNPEDGGCYAAFGAHPKFAVALERALTELLQGRELDQLHHFPMPTLDIEEVADPHNLETHFIDSSGLVAWDLMSSKTDYPFTRWNIEGDTQAEFSELCHRIHRVDMDIYIADYEHLGIYTCRIVVPGMSEIYPVDELIWRNNNAAATLRPAILALPDLETDALADLLEALDEGSFDEQQRVVELLGLVPNPESVWASLRVGELKLRLALALNDLELALELSDWVLGFAQLPQDLAAQYRCLHQLLSIQLDGSRDLEDFLPVFTRIYGEARIQRVRGWIAGVALFDDLGSHDESLATFNRHQQLLKVYERLQQVKSSHFQRP